MKLIVKHKDLQTALTALRSLSVSRMRANRGRAKLLRHLTTKLEEYIADEETLLADYVVLDEQGKIAITAEGHFTLKDPSQRDEVNQFLAELQEETVTLAFGEYQEQYEAFFVYLADADVDLTMEQLLVMDDLLDQFEKQQEKGGDV